MNPQKYRTGRKRIWAALVDTIVFMPLLLADQWIYRFNSDSPIVSWIIFTALLPAAYSIILHYKYGQTIGKWVAGVKVVDVSGTTRISVKQSVLRDIFYLAVQGIGIFYFLYLMSQASDAEYLFNDFDNYSGILLFLWTLLELITILMNSKRRAIHDFIARTVVVRTYNN
jgi:uncharacterized RDD family membrane protein YckC